MYPPSEESEEARIARNQAQSKWVFPFIGFFSGLLAIILGARSTGIAWTAGGAMMIVDSLLEKQGVSEKRRFAIRIATVTVILFDILISYMRRKH